MSEPTPRQVLYALVSAGFLLVVLLLAVGAAVSGLVPVWFTVVVVVTWVSTTVWTAVNWRRTIPILALSIGLFVVWAAVTLLVAR
jgi:hypothetical protein